MNDINRRFTKILLILSTFIGIFLLITIGALFFHTRGMMVSNNNGDDAPSNVSQIPTDSNAEELEVYELRMNATDYQIEQFDALMEAHEQFDALGTDNALQAYASAIVRNFIADFFTLSNKSSRADVGGVQFISSDVADYFTTWAIDTFYLHLGRYIQAYGDEAMPTIEFTTITEVEFDNRLIEVEEEESDEEIDPWEMIEPVEPEYEPIIVVYAEWRFASTILPHIDEFQTAARFVLKEVEDEGLRIFQIEAIEEECVYDLWRNCVESDDFSH